MKRKLLLAAIALIAVGALAWRMWPQPPLVETHIVKEAPATRVLAVNGRTRPRLSVDIQPRVAGDLVSLPFDVGDTVERGTLLARVDDGPQGEAVNQAQAALAGQRQALDQARRDLARYEAVSQYVTRQRIEQARLAVRQSEDEIRRLGAVIGQARQLRARNDVRAPFSGVIMERPVDPGQSVGTATILYRLADLTDPQVTAQVDELYAVALRPGQPARVAVPGTPGTLRAEIIHIEPRVDPETGARDVRLRILDPLPTAPAGLTVTVNLIVESRASAISVARSAIAGDAAAAHVLLVNRAGKVEKRAIRFIDWPAESVIVTQGLKPGERVLANPEAAKPGQQVRTKS